MYAAVPDPYCYPGTTVLINRLGIRDQARLDAFEAEVTAERANQPLPAGRLSYRHYRAIHQHLFQDVYAWAGKPRTVRIAKAGSMFCHPEHIDREMRNLFVKLARRNHLRGLEPGEFATQAAHFLHSERGIRCPRCAWIRQPCLPPWSGASPETRSPSPK